LKRARTIVEPGIESLKVRLTAFLIPYACLNVIVSAYITGYVKSVAGGFRILNMSDLNGLARLVVR